MATPARSGAVLEGSVGAPGAWRLSGSTHGTLTLRHERPALRSASSGSRHHSVRLCRFPRPFRILRFLAL